MQKLSTVSDFMGLIWVLLLRKPAVFYGKVFLVTFSYLA